MSIAPLLIERHGAIEVIALNRPDRLSAMVEPLIAALTKDALNLNIDAASMEHAFALEDRQQIVLGQTDNLVDASAAFLGKRAPYFGDH